MGCAVGFAKFILIIINLIFMLPSLAFIGVGIFVAVSANSLYNTLSNLLAQLNGTEEVVQQLGAILAQDGVVQIIAFVLIGFGVFLLLLSFFGCVGAIAESKCMLITYSVFIFLLAAAKIALIIVLLTSEAQFKNFITTGLKNFQESSFISINDFASSTDTNKKGVTYLVNTIHVLADCCGAVTIGDVARSKSWLSSDRNWTSGATMQIPATCCPVQTTSKANLYLQQQWSNISSFLLNENCPVTSEGMNSRTCYDSLFELISPFYWTVFGVGIGMIVIEALLIIFAMCIACVNKDEKIINRNFDSTKV